MFIVSYIEEKKQLEKEQLNEETYVKVWEEDMRKKVPWNPRLLNFNGPLKYRGIFSLIPASYIYDLYDENPVRFAKLAELYEADKANETLSQDSIDLINSITADLQNRIIESDLQDVEFDRESLYLVVKEYHKLKQSDISA